MTQYLKFLEQAKTALRNAQCELSDSAQADLYSKLDDLMCEVADLIEGDE